MNNREEDPRDPQRIRERILEKFDVYHGWCTNCNEPDMVLAIRLGVREWGYLCSSCIQRMFNRYSGGYNMVIGPVGPERVDRSNTNNVDGFVNR